MYGTCKTCGLKRIDVSCGSANCRASRIFENKDILEYVTITKDGLRCKLPFWWWVKNYNFKADHFNVRKFVTSIKKEINE